MFEILNVYIWYLICSNKRPGRLFLSDCDPGAFIGEGHLFKGGRILACLN